MLLNKIFVNLFYVKIKLVVHLFTRSEPSQNFVSVRPSGLIGLTEEVKLHELHYETK
jgi:hypothetical protein